MIPILYSFYSNQFQLTNFDDTSQLTTDFTMVSRNRHPSLLLFCIGICYSLTLLQTEAYSCRPLRRLQYEQARSSLFSSYGRNSEIWPPVGLDHPIKLADSFPNGEIPSQATQTLQQIGSRLEEPKPVIWKRRIPRAMARMLKRAASSQEEQAFSENTSGMDLTPAVAAMLLLVSGYVKPLDVILVSFLSGYFCILTMVARSLRSDNVTPVLPALPPQGHVPTLVSNPLGYSLTYSRQYDSFIKLGVLAGLLGPVLTGWRYALNGQVAASRVCARPIFFLCFQALSEAVGRRAMTPLPIRILVPVAYNTVRLGYLWNWCFFPGHLGALGRGLAVANLIYWGVNLFGFLLPVAAMRYMRAHFYCVEAEQVTTRVGLEEDTIELSLS